MFRYGEGSVEAYINVMIKSSPELKTSSCFVSCTSCLFVYVDAIVP